MRYAQVAAIFTVGVAFVTAGSGHSQKIDHSYQDVRRADSKSSISGSAWRAMTVAISDWQKRMNKISKSLPGYIVTSIETHATIQVSVSITPEYYAQLKKKGKHIELGLWTYLIDKKSMSILKIVAAHN